MSVSEEGVVVEGGSFWEIGQYKTTVRRIEDGLKLCHQLMGLVKERGEIEAQYAKALSGWSKKWIEQVEKGPEYGTMETAWKAVLVEAEKQHDLHVRMRERLLEEVYSTVKIWSKENFHKTAISGTIKEGKEMEEAFRKAQKPWAKQYEKVEKARKDYHQVCKTERSAINQERNALNDSTMSPEQQKKLAEKVEKCKEEKEKLMDVYKKALDELNRCSPKYMEDMTVVFERCQEMEDKRLKFLKEMLFGTHNCLDLSQEQSLRSIYEEFHRTIELADASQDLKLWSHQHGVGMPMNWPVFEDYSPELKRINKREKAAAALGGGTDPVLVGQRLPQAHNSATPSPTPPANGHHHSHGDVNHIPTNTNTQRESQAITTPDGGVNPYLDDWDAHREPLVDDGRAGVMVRALYDYNKVDDDELSFKKGDEFEMLEEEDELGWCKGRKDGRVGLYPANYAELVNKL